VIVNYESTFLKDVKKIRDPKLSSKLKSNIENLKAIINLTELNKIKKLKGHNIYYRLQIGDYRLGFSYENEEIDLIRFLHRKDIYKFFP
jgi:mRNA interferase RelE/StbE